MSTTKNFKTGLLTPTILPNKPLYAQIPNLKPLPVPSLQETAELFLESISAMDVSEKEKKECREKVDMFLKDGFVHELQNRLERRKIEMEKIGKSWLIDWWNDEAYLTYRDSVVINVSYFFQFSRDPYHKTQTKRAASIIKNAFQFRQLLQNQDLTPDTAGKEELDMSQYQYMFHQCRLPGKDRDTNIGYEFDSDHVVVLRKGQFFTVNGFSTSDEADIEETLSKIIQQADQSPASPAVGALTSEHRDKWYKQYTELYQHSAKNQEIINTIQSSAFIVCLDDTKPVTREEAGWQIWCGNERNRWYDKPLQFIVFENSNAGFLGEHSMMDATPTHRLCEFVLQNSMKLGNATSPGGAGKALPFDQLKFDLPPRYESYITQACQRLESDRQKQAHSVLAYFGMGKLQLKQFGVSPDAFMQLSILLAYYRLFNTCRPIYESAQTKKYLLGRTETCRSLNEDVLYICKNFDSVGSKEAVLLAKKAMKSQKEYMSKAVDGKGVDRHFLGLRKCIKDGEPVPPLFNDNLFKESKSWYLSTSQISSELYDGYGWGQVIENGFGIAYMIKQDSLHYNIACLKKELFGVGNAAEKMKESLVYALEDLKRVFKDESKVKSEL